jgi:hypothetical protein
LKWHKEDTTQQEEETNEGKGGNNFNEKKKKFENIVTSQLESIWLNRHPINSPTHKNSSIKEDEDKEKTGCFKYPGSIVRINESGKIQYYLHNQK